VGLVYTLVPNSHFRMLVESVRHFIHSRVGFTGALDNHIDGLPTFFWQGEPDVVILKYPESVGFL